MRQLTVLFIIGLYVLGFVQNGYTAEIGPSIKIEITHVHAHEHCHDCDDQHRHHSHAESSSESTNSPSDPSHDVPHSHEIAISGTASCVVFHQSFSFVRPIVLAAVPVALEQSPSKDAGLASIFRPPIA